jgi:hypothetical protein
MRLSIAAGDLSLLDGKWYVTHSVGIPDDGDHRFRAKVIAIPG